MNSSLNRKQRILASILYIATILILYYYANKDFLILNQDEDISIWFYSGILLIIMGKYLTEPYFTSPTDVLSNSIAIFLLLIQNSQEKIIGSELLLWLSIFLIIISLINIFSSKNSKINILSYSFSKFFGKSVFLYSFVFLSSTITYFGNRTFIYNFGPYMLFLSAALWVVIVVFDIYSFLIHEISKIFKVLSMRVEIPSFGRIVGNSGDLHLLEIDKSKFTANEINNIRTNSVIFLKVTTKIYLIYMISDFMEMSHNIFVRIKPIQSMKKYKIDMKTMKLFFNLPKLTDSIGDNYIMPIENLEIEMTKAIQSDKDFSRISEYVGNVQLNSNLNTICFSIVSNETKIVEGSIISVNIRDESVLYQVIGGFTKEDAVTNANNFPYIQGIARKIGIYSEDENELRSVNWIPNMNESVYLFNTQFNGHDLQSVANVAIGRLPGTNMAIPLKDIDSLVTHNTAILGVLGVGKSYLTFELIVKIVKKDIKVICIDITNQYAGDKGLPLYLDRTVIQKDFSDEHLSQLSSSSEKRGSQDTPSAWGNVNEYRELVKSYISRLLGQNDKKLLIFNPNIHNVSKASTLFKVTESVSLSLVEKTKIISEILLEIMMSKGMSDKAECCIVYEESHSLTPEWNSIVFKGDDEHSNGISKVILQGRKFGLGCILVTQRTANVTKNILNQCNTIFAMRIFDETGKSFLENYIGKDYAQILPTLEERHAVVAGKGLGIKQPVVIELNDARYTQNQTNAESETL